MYRMLSCSKRFFAKKRIIYNVTWIRDLAGCANKQVRAMEGLNDRRQMWRSGALVIEWTVWVQNCGWRTTATEASRKTKTQMGGEY
jgi:hypothetical protein